MASDRDENLSLQEQARLAHDSGDHARSLELLNNRGLIADVVQRSVLRRGAAAAFMRLGELKAARAELELAELELAHPDYHWPALTVRVAASVVNLHLGQSHDALTTAIDAMVQLAEAPDDVLAAYPADICSIRNNVALLFLSLGVPEPAIELLEQALLDGPVSLPAAAVRLNLAQAHLMTAQRRRAQRDPDWKLSASRCLAAVVGMNERDRQPRRLVEGATLSASVHLLSRDLDAAGRVLVASLNHCPKVHDELVLAQHHALLAKVLRRAGEVDDAYGWALRAVSHADDLFDRQAAGPIHLEMAKICDRLDRPAEAAHHYAKAIAVNNNNAQHVHALVVHLAAQAQLAVEHRKLLRNQGQLADQARLDPLTGIDNRHALEVALAEIAMTDDESATVAILFIDVDEFKAVNDQHEHAAGDDVLRRVARVVSQSLRADDRVFRFGGDEFVAILPGVDAQAAHITAERIRSMVEGDDRARTTVTVSIGCCVGRSVDVSMVLAGADAAMYIAKRAGRNRVAVAAPKATR